MGNGQEIKWAREHAARDREIHRLAVVECRSRKELSVQFDLSEGRIIHIVKEVDDLIRAEFPEHVAKIKDEQTQQLRFIYEEAMQAWERSKQVEEIQTARSTQSGKETSLTKRGQVGNPAYLDTAMRALADIRKIWGVEAAKKLEIGGTLGVLVGGAAGAPTREEAKAALAKRIQVLISEGKHGEGQQIDQGGDGGGDGTGGGNGHGGGSGGAGGHTGGRIAGDGA